MSYLSVLYCADLTFKILQISINAAFILIHAYIPSMKFDLAKYLNGQPIQILSKTASTNEYMWNFAIFHKKLPPPDSLLALQSRSAAAAHECSTSDMDSPCAEVQGPALSPDSGLTSIQSMQPQTNACAVAQSDSQPMLEIPRTLAAAALTHPSSAAHL
jgi:hypothetical protein